MPRKPIGRPPFPPISCFDEDRDFTTTDLARLLSERSDGVSLCVRYPAGPDERGGYFFHLRRSADENERYELYDFEKTLVSTFSPGDLVALINHCAGRRFDQQSFVRCQQELNLRSDPDSGA